MVVVYATNMTCESCVSKLQPHLDTLDSVRSWKTDLSDPRRLVRVTVENDSDRADVAKAISAAGFQPTELVDAAPPLVTLGRSASVDTTFATKPAFRILTYGPLFLVVAYVVAATGYVEWLSDGWNGSRAMRNFMGFFFLGFAFFKLLNVPKFADAFSGYDIIAKRSRTYALAYPLIEVLLGGMFLLNFLPAVASLGTIFVLGVGLWGVITAVRKRQTIQCACLGTAFNLPMSIVTIIENSVMVVMAVAMLLYR